MTYSKFNSLSWDDLSMRSALDRRLTESHLLRVDYVRDAVAGFLDGRLNVAFPDSYYGPSSLLKGVRDLAVPALVPLNLLDPPHRVGRKQFIQTAEFPESPCIPVPHVAIYKHRDAVFLDRDVRPAYNIARMEAIANSLSVNCFP
jgi:hypothetical protein